jgi:hypothetical protein
MYTILIVNFEYWKRKYLYLLICAVLETVPERFAALVRPIYECSPQEVNI